MTSNTCAKSLATLNDKFVVRQSELLAERVARLTSEPSGQATVAWRLALGREPTAQEAQAIATYAQRHGLANACRFLVNTNEFLFLD